jgi:hypothetical protein
MPPSKVKSGLDPFYIDIHEEHSRIFSGMNRLWQNVTSAIPGKGNENAKQPKLLSAACAAVNPAQKKNAPAAHFSRPQPPPGITGVSHISRPRKWRTIPIWRVSPM